MPEGDTIFRAATTLRKALVGRTITQFKTILEPVAAVNMRFPVVGRVVQAVESRGKHLVMVFRLPNADAESEIDSESIGVDLLSSDLVLHSHMAMMGSWHIYRPGEPWQKPARYARVVIHTDAFVAPCFSPPTINLLTAAQAVRHTSLTALGPDLLSESFDSTEARTRILRHPDVPIGVALMNQRLMAGVGNVYKSEVLFINRISPFATVSELSETVIDRLIAESQRLLKLNTSEGGRRTRFEVGSVLHYGFMDEAGNHVVFVERESR